MDDRSATLDMDRKVGGCCAPLFWGQENVGSPSKSRGQAMT